MRRLAIGVGVAATVAGAVLLLTPASAPIEPPVVPTLGLLALLGLGVGGLAGIDRARDPAATTALPDPDGRPGVDAPGDRFDRALAEVSSQPDDPQREAIRDRLESTAVTVLVEVEEIDPAEARDRLASGDWTEDEVAAAFFAHEPAISPSIRERLRRFLAGESTFARRARRAAIALAERDGER